ncbi:hypothetical protein DIE23_38750 [Burkholderia sp. Bp9143]|nr:hypothetical protein DIE23_38750 [Burkholderia sp. Bp9143]
MPVTARPELTADSGLAALIVIAKLHGIAVDAAQLLHNAALTSGCFEERDLILAARSIGLRARAVKITEGRLSKLALPALLLDNNSEHCVLAGCDSTRALVLERGASTS